MQEGDAALLDDVEAVMEHLLGFGRKAGDQIGAERDIGTQSAGTPGCGDGLGSAVPPLHPLQDQIVAGLQRQMQMRHQPRLLAEQPPELVVDLARIERGQPQARQLGHCREQPPNHLAEARPARQIAAIGGQIDAGQHDLAIAGSQQRARRRDQRAERHRPARPARIGDDAEGAAVIAALLHLQIGPRANPPLTLSLSP